MKNEYGIIELKQTNELFGSSTNVVKIVKILDSKEEAENEVLLRNFILDKFSDLVIKEATEKDIDIDLNTYSEFVGIEIDNENDTFDPIKHLNFNMELKDVEAVDLIIKDITEEIKNVDMGLLHNKRE